MRVAVLAAALEKNRVLTSIDFTGNGCSPQYTEAIGKALTKNELLRETFQVALRKGDEEVVGEMLREGVDAISNIKGENALLLALRLGHVACALLLVRSRYGFALLFQNTGGIPVLRVVLQQIEKMEKSLALSGLILAIAERLPQTDHFRELVRSVVPLLSWENDLRELLPRKEHVVCEWEEVEKLVNPREWVELRAQTEAALEMLRLGHVREAELELTGAEEAVQVERRLQLRTQLRALIVEERPKVAACFESLSCEVQFMTQSQAFAGASTTFVDTGRATVASFVAEVECVVALGRAMELMAASLECLRAGGGKECGPLQQTIERTRKELVERLNALDDDKVRGAVAKAKEHIGAQYEGRLEVLRVKKLELVEAGAGLERKLAELDRALEAGKRVESVKTEVALAQKAVERSKRELTVAEGKEKNATEDGSGSEAGLQKHGAK